jgi:hypothetical protein
MTFFTETGAGSNRRQFLSTVAGAALADSVGRGLRTEAIHGLPGSQSRHNENGHRVLRCELLKGEAASANSLLPIPNNISNRDDIVYEAKLGSYHKGLPHNDLGEVDPKAYAAMLHALESGRPELFESIPLGGSSKLSNPQGGLAFDLEACDSQQTFMATPPAQDCVQGEKDQISGNPAAYNQTYTSGQLP